MSNEIQIKQLAELFKKTGQAHHQAFIETDGEDPDWPIWYAGYLEDRLTPFLAAPITRSRLVFCLGPAEEPKTDRLALYHFDGCPFCIRVRGVIGELGLDVEMRNIYEDKTRREELREARGRTTVPVLRITSGDGQVRWMPESADIIRYLQVTYGRAAA
ncbi:MAG: glutathione S-transferase N-terminal domain-containing protein [Deltaproteobacteria bacterium]|nr:glutathione S-transferase N-terminal domain-containing protein [Deltaproteobacteria bacterium]